MWDVTVQQIALKDPAVRRKLGLAMKEPSETFQKSREMVTSKLEPSNLNYKNERISVESMSARELHNVSPQTWSLIFLVY